MGCACIGRPGDRPDDIGVIPTDALAALVSGGAR